MSISISGLGTLSTEDWDKLSPDATAHLLTTGENGSELWIGETPNNEDNLYTTLGGKILRGQAKQIDLPYASTFYTPELFDRRVDVYGYGDPAADGTAQYTYPLGDCDISQWHLDDYDTLRDAVRATVRGLDLGQRVVVNCQAGLNRSSLVVVLALVAKGWEPEEAIELIRDSRSRLCMVNKTFERFVTKHGKFFTTTL